MVVSSHNNFKINGESLSGQDDLESANSNQKIVQQDEKIPHESTAQLVESNSKSDWSSPTRWADIAQFKIKLHQSNKIVSTDLFKAVSQIR